MTIRKYNPNATGLDRWFGPLEAKVLDILWSAGRPMDIEPSSAD